MNKTITTVAVGTLLVLLAALPNPKTSVETTEHELLTNTVFASPQPQNPLKTPVEKPQAKKTLSLAEKIKSNYYKCNLDTEYIRKDNARCIKKPRASEPVVTAQKPTGNSGPWQEQCHIWAAQAGVTLTDSAITLLDRESDCDPTICNPNGIACGIPQALPWTKMGCALSVADAPCQIKWMYNYVLARYGSWDAALAHSYANNWY